MWIIRGEAKRPVFSCVSFYIFCLNMAGLWGMFWMLEHEQGGESREGISPQARDSGENLSRSERVRSHLSGSSLPHPSLPPPYTAPPNPPPSHLPPCRCRHPPPPPPTPPPSENSQVEQHNISSLPPGAFWINCAPYLYVRYSHDHTLTNRAEAYP